MGLFRKALPPKERENKKKSTDKQTDLMCFLGHKKLQKNEFWHQQNLWTDLPKKSTDQQTDKNLIFWDTLLG